LLLSKNDLPLHETVFAIQQWRFNVLRSAWSLCM
jgi:hypothetical protein